MHDSVHPRRLTLRPRAGLLAAATLLSGVLVAGCAGGSESPTVANVGSSTTATSSAAATGAATATNPNPKTASPSSTATSAGAAGSGQRAQAGLDGDELAYAACMRANGVADFPDPKQGGGLLIQVGAGVDPGSPAFMAAQAKCHRLLPGGGPPEPGTQSYPSPEALAQMLTVAQCMRGHGVSNFPDPRTAIPSDPRAALGGAGVISDIDGVILVFPGTIDEQSPLFTRAAAACDFPLHNH
jgi:hypothetical protein